MLVSDGIQIIAMRNIFTISKLPLRQLFDGVDSPYNVCLMRSFRKTHFQIQNRVFRNEELSF